MCHPTSQVTAKQTTTSRATFIGDANPSENRGKSKICERSATTAITRAALIRVLVDGLIKTSKNHFQFNVHNGVISSTPAAFARNVLDSVGNVSFSGPCPIKESNGNTHGTAVFTGILSGGNQKFGHGSWICNADAGPANAGVLT